MTPVTDSSHESSEHWHGQVYSLCLWRIFSALIEGLETNREKLKGYRELPGSRV